MIPLKKISDWRSLSCRQLMAEALAVKLAGRGDKFSLCSIINAKSGKCSEDCRFCTQSAHYRTDTPVFPLLSTKEIVTYARQAKENGASHFSLVTSGQGLHGPELDRLIETITVLCKTVNIKLCASLGILNQDELSRLKKAGLSRFHHNLETSAEFFPRIVTTHTFAERTATLKAAKKAGLETCSGGIIGLGESEDDRISLAESLRRCQVDSAVINILIPLPGTPMADIPPLAINDILRTIALFRLILPDTPLRLAAGRESALADFLSSAFLAGADAMMIGGYLTRRGRSVAEDLQFVSDMKKIWQ
jgi:biotin synthase